MTNKPTRLSRARQIRDSAVEVLQQRGVWERAEIADGKTVNVLQVQTDDLHVVLRTPFQQLPDVPKSEHMKYLGALKNIARTYPRAARASVASCRPRTNPAASFPTVLSR